MAGRQREKAGFTLIELMIVLLVLAIIMSIAIPSYRDYVRRSNRTDATTALLRIAAAQEKFYLQNGQYASDAQLAAAPPDGLGFDGTERGFYEIRIASDNLSTGYTITATATGPQTDDTNCQTFTVDERGQRGSAPGDIGICWK